MVNKFGNSKSDMTRDEFIYWLYTMKNRYFAEVVEKVADFYRVARDTERAMISSVLIMDAVSELSNYES